MLHTRTLVAWVLGTLALTPGLDAQDLSQYRTFALGGNVASVTAHVGVAPTALKTVHQRPAMLQELEWRPSRWNAGSSEPSTDPVELMRFSFYNDQLYGLVVDYNTDRTEGLTAADLIAALSDGYGVPLPKASWRTGLPLSPIESESGAVVARWADSEHAAVLYHLSSYRPAFRLVLTQTRLDALARKAEAQATRLDAQEAPGRELAKQKKDADDRRDAAEKARAVNKGTFRP